MLYHKLIEEHLDVRRIVLSDGQTEMTYRQMHEKTAQYCAVFQKMEIKKGERIAVETGNLINTVIILLACIAKGLIFVPVNQKLDKESKDYIIKNCSPSLIIDEKHEIGRNFSGNSNFDMENRELCTEDTLVYILYTSGSEGEPKGVVSSQKQIFYCCREINRMLKNTGKDRILCCLPLSFDYGMYQIFLAFLSGSVLYLDSGEVIQRIPYLLKKWNITAFPTIPSVMNLLIKYKMLKKNKHSLLRYITFTGEILPVSLIRKTEDIYPETRIIPMYGLTECKRVSIMPENREDKVRAGSCGIPLAGIKVYLRNQESGGAGELVVEGDNVMEGYWGITDDCTKVFAANRKTGKRLIYTGDIFRIDEEGFLYFCGRKNRIIKIFGHRISGVWIENKLNTVDGILEAAVLGIPDRDAGEKLGIFIYSDREEIGKDIREQMKDLPGYLRKYELFIDKKPLPKNQNGKIATGKLLERVR